MSSKYRHKSPFKKLAGPLGFEPRIRESKSRVLPITPWANGRQLTPHTTTGLAPWRSAQITPPLHEARLFVCQHRTLSNRRLLSLDFTLKLASLSTFGFTFSNRLGIDSFAYPLFRNLHEHASTLTIELTINFDALTHVVSIGGRGGIRTHTSFDRQTVFKTVSATQNLSDNSSLVLQVLPLTGPLPC